MLLFSFSTSHAASAGSGTRIRTLIARSRVWRPAIRRSPSISLPPHRLWMSVGTHRSKERRADCQARVIFSRFPYRRVGFHDTDDRPGIPMELSFWAATDVGRKREINEDNFLVDKKLSLFVVADGMGGHASGEVASKLAVHEFRNAVESSRESIDKFAKGDPSVRPQDVLTVLEEAVQSAGQAVYKKGQVEPEKRGMGTTTSALLIAGDRGFIAHVGDSRIYMLRGGQVVQLTEDHSLVNELIRRGRVTKEGFETSPYKAYKNAVTRAVGVYEQVQGDTIDFEILPGDQFLLCSDGLHAYLNDARIIDNLKGDDVKALPKKLIDLANAGGGHDNI